MTPETLLLNAINPALEILPEKMCSTDAKAMMLAIALQESRCRHRRQIGGPARSYWQFEQGGGVRGVLQHPTSKGHIETCLYALDYPRDSDASYCFTAIEHNDILAACFARLLLWTLPSAMPTNAEDGWAAYISAWRPGKPHPETWNDFYQQAKEIAWHPS